MIGAQKKFTKNFSKNPVFKGLKSTPGIAVLHQIQRRNWNSMSEIWIWQSTEKTREKNKDRFQTRVGFSMSLNEELKKEKPWAAFIEPWPRSGPRDQRSGDCRGLGRENVWNGRRLKPGRNMLHRLAWREFVLMWHGCSTDWPIVIFSEPSQDEAVWHQI